MDTLKHVFRAAEGKTALLTLCFCIDEHSGIMTNDDVDSLARDRTRDCIEREAHEGLPYPFMLTDISAGN